MATGGAHQKGSVKGTNGGGAEADRMGHSGWVVFASVMMIFGGTMGVLEGITALRKDEVLVVNSHYAYTFDTTGWGWIHLILGILVVLAGIALFRGALWARVTAVFLAGLAMIANFLWLPYFPLWAIVLIGINAFVIWAVCTSGSRSARVR
jgi:hypothetical protein